MRWSSPTSSWLRCALLCLPFLTFTLALPAQNHTNSLARYIDTTSPYYPLDLLLTARISLFLTSHDYPDPFTWRILGQKYRSLIFSAWGEELPNFDDVIQVIETAQKQLTHDSPLVMKKVSEWEEGTARIFAMNDQGRDGMTQREMISFLDGLRLSGEVLGFFKSHVVLWDRQLTISDRGKLMLTTTKPKVATS